MRAKNASSQRDRARDRAATEVSHATHVARESPVDAMVIPQALDQCAEVLWSVSSGSCASRSRRLGLEGSGSTRWPSLLGRGPLPRSREPLLRQGLLKQMQAAVACRSKDWLLAEGQRQRADIGVASRERHDLTRD